MLLGQQHIQTHKTNLDPCILPYTQIHISPYPCGTLYFLESVLHLKALAKFFPDNSSPDPNNDSTDSCLIKKKKTIFCNYCPLKATIGIGWLCNITEPKQSLYDVLIYMFICVFQ